MTESSTVSILDMDATTLSQKIQAQQLTSSEIVKTYINHIKSINPIINALVEDRFEEALKEAKQADEKVQQGKPLGKLHGIPITLKDAMDVKGMKTTGGLIHLKDNVAEEDAELVKRLKLEGAIIIGKTNTPVLCFCQETDNKLYGRTNNPWDITRTAGGSSGGEGALIASGGAAVGIGSDIGGSIRFPSHFNGTVGFKSGNNQVPIKGNFPDVTIALQKRMFGVGAIAKSVADATLIHHIIADSIPKSVDLSQFELNIPIENLVFPANDSTKRALLKAKSALSNRFFIIDSEPLYYRDAALYWQLIMSINNPTDSYIAFNGKRPRFLYEFLKEKLTKKSKLHFYYTWAGFGANLFKPSAKKVAELEEIIPKLEKEVNAYLQHRILILPVYHETALQHGKVYWEIFSIKKTFLKYMPFVAYANTWGLPSLTVPVAEDERGLPIGLQVISAVGNEDAIFQVGQILENKLRGFKRAL